MEKEISQKIEELKEELRMLSEKQNSQYTDVMLLLKEIAENLQTSGMEEYTDDELYEDAKEVVMEYRTASTSFLQRILRIGYARAARVMDQLEEEGIVSAADGTKPRKVLGIQPEDLE